MWQQILQQTKDGDVKALARCISFVENEVEGYRDMLRSLPSKSEVKIIGITGPPGAGKSTLVNCLLEDFSKDNKRTAVICIDPSSPFHHGALLGDRIRMQSWFNQPNVYIRSLATRGATGGLNPKAIEVTDLLKVAGFDNIIVETVGVGQTEVEIAGLADVTVVVLVPESGDLIQTMKAGLMEVADIFVVNKCDRPGADALANDLLMILAPAFNTHKEIPVIKTDAILKEGITALKNKIIELTHSSDPERKLRLTSEKAFQLIREKRMNGLTSEEIYQKLKRDPNINLYQFIEEY